MVSGFVPSSTHATTNSVYQVDGTLDSLIGFCLAIPIVLKSRCAFSKYVHTSSVLGTTGKTS